MSTTFLNAAETRKADSPVPVGDGSANPRQKITELSEKVVDSNPYSRLMCAHRSPPLSCERAFTPRAHPLTPHARVHAAPIYSQGA